MSAGLRDGGKVSNDDVAKRLMMKASWCYCCLLLDEDGRNGTRKRLNVYAHRLVGQKRSFKSFSLRELRVCVVVRKGAVPHEYYEMFFFLNLNYIKTSRSDIGIASETPNSLSW